MNLNKKYRIATSCLIIIIILFFVLFVFAFVKYGDESYIAYIAALPCILVGILLRITRTYFYKRGYCSKKEARSFHNLCKANQIEYVSKQSLDQIRRIYKKTVYELSSKALQQIDEYELYKTIYTKGSKENRINSETTNH